MPMPRQPDITTTAVGEKATIAVISIAWALFQLALPRFIILDSVKVRAVHLAFALVLVFLTISIRRYRRMRPGDRTPAIDYVLAGIGCLAAVYIVLDWEGIAGRAGIPILRDTAFSLVLIVLVLEAARRVIGPALGIIAILFTVYAFLGPYMPSILAFRGVSLPKYISQIALSTEGIYGIPLDVSANTVFLFVLLGSMLDKAGAGHFYNDLAISLLDRSGIGLEHCQCRYHRHLHHPADEEGWLSGQGRCGNRSGSKHQRPAYATDHGRRRLHNRRVSRHPLP
jgi:TRAP-type uncharacterized transport system fused permease subunit